MKTNAREAAAYNSLHVFSNSERVICWRMSISTSVDAPVAEVLCAEVTILNAYYVDSMLLDVAIALGMRHANWQ